MTRTHFKKVASIIQGSTHANDIASINKDYLVDSLCEYFELINVRFDAKRFVRACNKYSSE